MGLVLCLAVVYTLIVIIIAYAHGWSHGRDYGRREQESYPKRRWP